MKIFPFPFLPLVGALLSTTASARSLTGLRFRSTADRHISAEYGSKQRAVTQKDAPSCKIITEMLQRIYYMRARLDAVTDSLGTIGYTPGSEWKVDQDIGTVNATHLKQVLCPLLEGPPSKDPSPEPPSRKSISFLGLSTEQNSAEDNTTSKGCPPESPQSNLLHFLEEEFKGTSAEDKKLGAVKAIFVDLLGGVEKSMTNLYSFRECPIGGGEFKTRQMCQLHREDQSKALKMLQSDLPAMRARVNSMTSRVKAINSGVSRECYISKKPAEEQHSDLKQEYCLNITALTDAILDGRKSQKRWLKNLGDDMQRLGIMAMQVRNRITDPALRQDKIPLNALKGLENSWSHLEPVMQAIRLTGPIRAEHAGSVDAALLGLAGLLKNMSNENGCIAEQFRLRYSAQSCQSLKSQLEATLHERKADLESLQNTASTLLVSAGRDLKTQNCTAAPQTEGCWLRFPSGCPKIRKWEGADKWSRDVFGEESTGSGQNSDVCLKSRKLQMDSLCGVADTEMRFIPGAPA